MARVALCDRCGAIIRDAIIKQVSFSLNPSYKANGFALKWKGGRGKHGVFFNSSQRMSEKEEFRKQVEGDI